MTANTVTSDENSAFGGWLKSEMLKKGVTIGNLSEKTGITYTGIRNIVVGNTVSPRPETRKNLADALQETVPAAVEATIESEAASLPGMTWVDFTPSDLETVPQSGGVYVFYDITDRPVYVGKSNNNVRSRVKDHQTRFWFKEPLVVRGAFLAISDPDLCVKVETILIKFLGKHALLNVKGVTRDLED
ncbi:hypothetical protein DK419_19380 [Methylobacterium terrae]|uniref:GIY-YIG domain-containing protein n=2 Tax=Methylobacterium terrae TaxID=2202827 RepID=A0A2U8WX97_9HYPH|nr:hypothetical protein DK419_19380 [Methylobacterium terrae]